MNMDAKPAVWRPPEFWLQSFSNLASQYGFVFTFTSFLQYRGYRIRHRPGSAVDFQIAEVEYLRRGIASNETLELRVLHQDDNEIGLGNSLLVRRELKLWM